MSPCFSYFVHVISSPENVPCNISMPYSMSSCDKGSNFVLHVDIRFSQCHLLRRLFSPHWMILAPLHLAEMAWMLTLLWPLLTLSPTYTCWSWGLHISHTDTYASHCITGLYVWPPNWLNSLRADPDMSLYPWCSDGSSVWKVFGKWDRA